MNSASNSKIQGTQSSKTTSPKRAHRANRPVLVTEQSAVEIVEPIVQESAEVALAVETVEPVEGKRRPGFFSNISRSERVSDQPEADPKTARMARALRGKAAGVSDEPVKEKKLAISAPKASYTPARPRSGFKMKYILGMMAYLLIADFLGVWITDWMQANHLDAHLFTWGPFVGNRSTLIFLALLVIILIVMARLDLIPRSFGAMMSSAQVSGSTVKGSAAKGSATKAPTFETRASQPVVKQGVKGKDDGLYKEYRENQRYFQKRDRKH